MVSIIILTLLALLSSGLLSCTDKAPGELRAEIAGRWSYSFPPGLNAVPDFDYDPEGGLIDAITINSVEVNGKGYLLLSFAPSSSWNNSRLFIFDIGDAISPRLISTIAPERRDKDSYIINSAAVQNNILYGGLFLDKGLWMVDISDPGNPQDLGIALVGVTSNLIVADNHAYASGQLYNGISVSDVSDVRNVQEIARIDLSTRECHLAVDGERLYVSTGKTLTVFDVSIPASSKIISTYELEVSDGLVTELPFHVPGQIHWADWANIIDLQASGNYIYLTFGAGHLRVIDVSDPATPSEVADVNLGGFAIALTLKDGFLYVTKSDAETQLLQLCIVDISDPESPRLLDTITTESIFGFGGATFCYCWMRPQVIGDYIYIAGINYMDVIEIR